MMVGQRLAGQPLTLFGEFHELVGLAHTGKISRPGLTFRLHSRHADETKFQPRVRSALRHHNRGIPDGCLAFKRPRHRRDHATVPAAFY